jgi:hypothetical protein
VFLNFDFSFFMSKASGSTPAGGPLARGFEEALRSTWLLSWGGSISKFRFQLLSGKGI